MGTELERLPAPASATGSMALQRGVGKQTLTETLAATPIAREDRASTETVEPFDGSRTMELLGSGGIDSEQPSWIVPQVVSPQPSGSNPITLDFDIPLPAQLVDQIAGVYDHYRKTGKVQSLDGIRYQVLVASLVWAVPMDEVTAGERVAAGRRLLFGSKDATDPEMLAWLVGLAVLPKRGGKTLPRRTVVSSVTIGFERGELATLRGTPAETTDVAPTPQGWLEWGWGIIQGDFNEDPSLSQTIVTGLLGLIPVVDQALDLRDVVANLYTLIGQQRYDELDPWFNLVATVIGAIPEVGSVLKPIIKGLRKAASKVPIEWALSTMGRALPEAQRLLGRFVDGFGELSIAIAARARTLLYAAENAFAKARDSVGLLATKAKQFFEELVARAGAALARLDEKVRSVLADIKQRLGELLGDLAERATKSVDKEQVAKSAYRVWLEGRFRELYGESVVVHRGIRLKPNGKVEGVYASKNGEGQMVIANNPAAATHYGYKGVDLESAKRAEHSEIVVISFEIRVDHIARDANDPDLQHLFLKPDVDITKLPGYTETRYDARTFNPFGTNKPL